MSYLVLITGGAGAIGSNIAAELLSRGFRVHVLDDLSSGSERLLHREAAFTKGSVASDEDLATVFAEGPDYVVHLAALFANQNSVEHPSRDLIVNALGTLKVLEHSQAAGVRKMVYTSSSCVYGQKELMQESEPDLTPETPYAISKLTGERYCRFWADHHAFDSVVVRLFNSYGPGEFPGRYRNVIPNFFKLAFQGQPLVITGTGEETRDFNFVTDTAQGILGALFGNTRPAEIFNIASGTATRIIDVARIINELTGNSGGIQFAPRREWDRVSTRKGSTDLARERFGYEPGTRIDGGLRRTYEWLKENV